MAGNKRKGRGTDDKVKGKKIAKIGQPSVSFHPLMTLSNIVIFDKFPTKFSKFVMNSLIMVCHKIDTS